jgi:glycosyltransferase involved in cell wall biosynthesis
MNIRPKILFTTPVLRHPASGGPYLRIENSIKALSYISELYIYCRSHLHSIGGASAVKFYKRFCKEFYFAPFAMSYVAITGFARRVVNLAARIFIRRNILAIQEESENDFKDLLRIADRIGADLIWLGYGNISYPLLKYIKENSNYKVVLDTDSVWSRFLLRGLSYAKDDKTRRRIELEGREKEEEERWGTEMADVTTAVSEVDMEYYQALIEDKSRVKLFSNVIDLDNYKERPPNADIKRPAVYLAGSFGKGSPMEEAARWTIENALPIVWKKYPNLHFYIIGMGSKEVLSDIDDERITVSGKVHSVLPYLCNVNVALVPLKFESGTRFKILEAGACGIPIVSTTLGAEGIPVRDGKDILIADTPEDFAAAIIRLLGNEHEASTLAENCRKLVEDGYSIKAAKREAEKIIEKLLGKEGI